MNKRTLSYILPLALLGMAALACNAPFWPGAAEQPGLESTMPPVLLDTGSMATPEGPVVELNPCSLLSKQQAEAALGMPLVGEPAQQLWNCVYTGENLMLTIGAAQNEDAKDTVLIALDLLIIFLPMDEAVQQYEEMERLKTSLTVSEMVQRAVPIYEMIGFQFQPASIFGGETYWGWSEQGGGMLFYVEGGTYINMTLFGLDEPLALQAATSVLTILKSHLPARFTVAIDGVIEVE